MSKQFRILITSAGSPGVPSLIRDLKKSGEDLYLVSVDLKQEVIGNLFSDKNYLVPAWDGADYISSLLKIIDSEKIEYVLPNDDSIGLCKLCTLAKERPDLKISVSRNLEHLNIATDKGKLYDFLHAARLAEMIPRYRLVVDKKELIQTIIDFGYPAFPVAIKPAQAEGSRGFRVISELRENIFEKKINSIYLNLSELEASLEQIDKLPELLVMEYLPGQEYSVDVLVDKWRKVQYAIPRTRAEICAGLPLYSSVEKNDKLTKFVEQILKELELIYALNFQFKYDRNGQPKLLEINPRLGGTMTCCSGAGANIHYHLLLAMAEQPIPLVQIQYGTKMFRFYDEKYLYP